jgi:trehalose synthase
MAHVEEVHIGAQSLERMAPYVDPAELERLRRLSAQFRRRLAGRAVWNINSTARGGGVAEMLYSLVGYARGEGVDCRWVVIHGEPAFFHMTKRLHNALHGSPGDSSPLGAEERALYEHTLQGSASELSALVQPGDIVLLHDPQTAGLARPLAHHGAHIIWRCHIGADEHDDETERGWAFLRPYLADAHAYVFSRREYIPPGIEQRRCVIIPPTIDPVSAKNQPMDEDTVRAILVHCGMVEGPPGPGQPVFAREDSSAGRVDRCADIIRLGRAPGWDVPLVVQVSRWDRLKDHAGVLEGFARMVAADSASRVELVLAGPNVKAVADDPEGAEVFNEIVTAWRALPHGTRQRVHLVNLPMADVEENAAMVNALQHHATVVVQKSLREGFGLTVAEAMWKRRAVVASAVGGIKDQIEDGISGLLLPDPRDVAALATTLRDLLDDPEKIATLGGNAQRRVRDNFLGLHSLIRYGRLILRLAGSPRRGERG